MAKWALQQKDTWKESDQDIDILIYGVKSSGNQSERGLRETARMSAA